MPVQEVRPGTVRVHVPVGAPVAHQEAFEENSLSGVLYAVLLHLVGQGGHVDACVALAGDEEVVGGEFGVQGEPLHQGREVVLRRDVVSGVVVGGVAHHGVAHACRRLDVEHVGDAVPRVGVRVHAGVGLAEHEGTVLHEGTLHRGTAWATVKPQN